MGYTTEFDGSFEVTPPLEQEHIDYLEKFSKTRRMKRNASTVKQFSDPYRESIGLPIGDDGEYFVGGFGFHGQDVDQSVIDQNNPPATQPGLWCQWVPTDDGKAIEWNGAEKFYNYVEWLEYIVEHFLSVWGYKLNGTVRWRGEDFSDIGTITVKNNIVKEKQVRW